MMRLKIAVAERIAEIPPHAEENNFALEVAPFKWIPTLVAHEGNLFRSFLSTVVLCQSFFATLPVEAEGFFFSREG